MTYKLIKDLDTILDNEYLSLAKNDPDLTIKMLMGAAEIYKQLYKIFPQPELLTISLKPASPVDEIKKQIEQLRRLGIIFSFTFTYSLLDEFQEVTDLNIFLQIDDVIEQMTKNYNKAVDKGLGQTECYIDFPQDFHYLYDSYTKVIQTQKKPISPEIEKNLTVICGLFNQALQFTENQRKLGICAEAKFIKQFPLFFPLYNGNSHSEMNHREMKDTPSTTNQM